MRVLKVRGFARFQRKEGMADAMLCRAVRDAAAGLVDADLGNGLIKQRVARPGQGKRGSYRTIIAYRARDRAVFLFGFAKNVKADLAPDELRDLIRVGATWLDATNDAIEVAIADEILTEIHCEEEEADDEDEIQA